MNKTKTTLSIVLLLSVVLSSLDAATYLVGKGKDFATLQDVVGRLKPGDIVLVDGDASYPSGVYIDRSGTEKNWITIRGVRSGNGSRPVISGNDMYGINVSADFVVIEGLQISGLAKGIGVFGDNIKVRDCIINDCNHGLIGYGTGTGNVTVEYCEFYGNGVPTGGATQHQIYMATDEIAHPGATFRLQYCYLHDAVQGDNVKSRAERNEIYYNWMENAGSSGHGLGLFAPDPEDNEDVSIETAREDTDVVGNVIIQQRNSCARIGGDAPGYPTNGRYRFVNNTFILTGSRGDCIRTFNSIETLEMYNNVIYNLISGADIRVVNDADGEWKTSPRLLTGSNNWVREGASRIPGEWSSTLSGNTSPFVNADEHDFTPLPGGALINAGAESTPTISSAPFTNPLFPPAFHPPHAVLIDTGSEQSRPVDGSIDIGALENASSKTVKGCKYHLSAISLFCPGDRKTYSLNGRIFRGEAGKSSGIRLLVLKETDKSRVIGSTFTK